MPTDSSTPDLRGMILGALSDVGGRDYLARQAIETPDSFLALLGSVVSTQLTGEGGGAPIIEAGTEVPKPKAGR